MRKFLFVFVVLFFLVAFRYPLSAHADFNSAYQDYVFNYQQYRTANSQFQIARSSYETYHTLTSQNDAITKFRQVLKSRDQVVAVYYNLIQEKMNSTEGMDPGTQKTFSDIRQSEKTWLDANQKKIDAAGSLDDLNSVSNEFEQRFNQMDTETKQAIGTIETIKLTHTKDRINSSITDLSNKLNDIASSGEDTSSSNRGIISAKNKLDLFDQKISDAHDVFYPKQNSNTTIRLYDGQVRLTEASQYLRETVDFLSEIVKNFTG